MKRMRRTIILAVALVAVVACGNGKTSLADDVTITDQVHADAAIQDGASGNATRAADGAKRVDVQAPPGLVHCGFGEAFSPPAVTGFRHTTSELVVAVSNAEHSAQDVVVHPSTAAEVPGKFAYGRFSKDLEDEDVELFVHDCGGWVSHGVARTDSDGRVRQTISTGSMAPGRYQMRQVALGDGTVAPSVLSVLPSATRLIVLDIDGTLTTGDSEIVTDAIDEFFVPIYDGDYRPEAYPDAQALTHLLYEKGWQLVYLTGRPYWLTGITREWLESEGFAPGHLHVTDSNGEALPSEDGVGAFKRDYLQSLTTMGYVFDRAYGNAETDIFAFSGAGVAPADTYIIGDNAGSGGTQGLSDGYTEHLTEVRAWSSPSQPY